MEVRALKLLIKEGASTSYINQHTNKRKKGVACKASQITTEVPTPKALQYECCKELNRTGENNCFIFTLYAKMFRFTILNLSIVFFLT